MPGYWNLSVIILIVVKTQLSPAWTPHSTPPALTNTILNMAFWIFPELVKLDTIEFCCLTDFLTQKLHKFTNVTIPWGLIKLFVYIFSWRPNVNFKQFNKEMLFIPNIPTIIPATIHRFHILRSKLGQPRGIIGTYWVHNIHHLVQFFKHGTLLSEIIHF